MVDTKENSSLPKEISFTEGLKVLFTGIDLPRSMNSQKPDSTYTELSIPIDDNKSLDAWFLPTFEKSKGTVLIFHGYMDNKGSMLGLANEFLGMGYNTLLVDFMGTGKSYGNQTTMGYLEAENVHATYKYATENLNENNILIYGFSMGAVASIKAVADYQMDVKGIMLQAPYATLEGTIGERIKQTGMPRQPLASIFTFWMGKVNGFDGFDAKPIIDAQKINIPTLIMSGLKDPHIPKAETEAIYKAVGTSQKTLQFFENSKHESLLIQHPDLWKNCVKKFIHDIESQT